MTELIINGTRAVLPKDINFTMFEENPLFTQNGEFSLDITLSLMNPVNAKIFKHINRLNVSEIITEAEANLIADNKVSRGKIIDIKNTDKTVSFQYVAGNSEFNFMAQNKKKIWQLDFGTESAVDYARALFSIQHPGYGQVIQMGDVVGFNKFVCVPVKFRNLTANDYTISRANTIYEINEIDGVNNIVIQPYLMHYINTLPELLGFQVVENVLMQDQLALELYMPNRVQSLRYSDMLPDKSISEFIDDIEEFFNIFFLVTNDRKCHILNRDSYVDNKEIRKLKNVLDNYERENEVQDVDQSSISYDLSDEGYLRYQRLKKDLVDVCQRITHSSSNVMKNSLVEADLNKFVIHITSTNNREHVFTPPANMNVYRVLVPGTSGYCYYVNKLKDSSQSDNPKVLSIKPLPFTYIDKLLTNYIDYYEPYSFTVPFQIPIVNSDVYVSQNQNVLEAIEDSLELLPRENKIEVAIYSGLVECFVHEFAFLKYPISYIDNNPEFWLPQMYVDSPETPTYESNLNLWITEKYKPVCSKTLRLTGDDGIFNRYHVTNQIDTSKVYIFKCMDKNITTNYLYEHNGAIYIPFSIEKNVDIDGESEIKTAKFYKLK